MYPFAVLAGTLGGYIFPDNILDFNSINNSRVLLLKNGDLYAQGNGAGGANGLGNSATYSFDWVKLLTNCRMLASYISGAAVITNDGKFYTTGYANFVVSGLLSYTLVDRTDRVFPAGGPISPSDVKEIVVSYNAMFFLMNNGDLWGMGSNDFQELGRTGAVTTPVLIASNVKKAQVEYRIGAYLSNDGKFFAAGQYAGDMGYANRNLPTFTQLTDADQDARDVYIRDFNMFSAPRSQSVYGAYSISPTATGACTVYSSRNAFMEDDRPARPSISLCRRINSFTGNNITFPHKISYSNGVLATVDGINTVKGQNSNGELSVGNTSAVTVATPSQLPQGITSEMIQFDIVNDSGSQLGPPEGNTRYMIVKGALFVSGIVGSMDKNKPAVTRFVQTLNMPMIQG